MFFSKEIRFEGGYAMDLYLLGKILGYLIVTFYSMALMNFVLKWINRSFKDSLKTDNFCIILLEVEGYILLILCIVLGKIAPEKKAGFSFFQ